MACVGDSISPPNLPVHVLLILCFCFISNLLKTQHLPSLKLTAKAPENGWLEDELSFSFGAKGLFWGAFAVSFREDPLFFLTQRDLRKHPLSTMGPVHKLRGPWRLQDLSIFVILGLDETLGTGRNKGEIRTQSWSNFMMSYYIMLWY